MRDRRSADWAVDLDGRHRVEGQVGDAVDAHPRLALIRDSTASFERLDFELSGPGGQRLELEVKAKNQPLSGGWRGLRPDVDPADLFVLDELAMRKLVDAGRRGFNQRVATLDDYNDAVNQRLLAITAVIPIDDLITQLTISATAHLTSTDEKPR